MAGGPGGSGGYEQHFRSNQCDTVIMELTLLAPASHQLTHTIPAIVVLWLLILHNLNTRSFTYFMAFTCQLDQSQVRI